jgi:hypothetical protein
MQHDVWKQTPDSVPGGKSSLTLFKFTEEHFVKNPYNRMRSYLAFQVTGESMLTMLDEYGPNVPNCTADTHDSIKEIVKHVDRYVDVMNGHNKDCENINSASHPHLEDLLALIRVFTEWKLEAGKNTERFIPVTTYEDLCWSSFAVIGIAKNQLPEGRAMVQKRLGSDVCEKSFGKACGKNANGTAKDYRHIMAHTEGANLQTFSGHSKTNASGDKVILKSEVSDALPKRPPKQKKTGT